MNANGSVKVSLRSSKLYGHSVPLGDLTSVWTHVVEPNHTFLQETLHIVLYTLLSFKSTYSRSVMVL